MRQDTWRRARSPRQRKTSRVAGSTPSNSGRHQVGTGVRLVLAVDLVPGSRSTSKQNCGRSKFQSISVRAQLGRSHKRVRKQAGERTDARVGASPPPRQVHGNSTANPLVKPRLARPRLAIRFCLLSVGSIPECAKQDSACCAVMFERSARQRIARSGRCTSPSHQETRRHRPDLLRIEQE